MMPAGPAPRAKPLPLRRRLFRHEPCIGLVGKAFGLTRIPELAEIYDDRFLPPREERIPLQ
jgi:hypothetical protein